MHEKPEIEFLNEKTIFKRRVDIDFAIFEQELLENRLNKIKIHKIQQIDDLIKINSVTDSFTDEFFDSEYFDYTHCLFTHDDEIKIKTISERISIRKFETSFGLMVSSNRGEWGGQLYNITEYGAEEAGSGNFVGIFEYKDKLYALDTLSHLSMNTCRLHEIKKHENEFEDITIFESDDLTFGGYYLEDNYLYFHSDSWDFPGLYRLKIYLVEFVLKV